MWEISKNQWGYANQYSGTDKTSGTSISATFSFAVGSLTVFSVTMDNLTATTPTVASLPKPAGETASWTLLAQHDSNQAGGGGGVRSEIWGIVCATGGGTLSGTVSLSQAVSAKAWVSTRFTGGPSTLQVRGSGGTTSAGVINSTVAQLTGVTPAAGELVVLVKGQEGTDSVAWEAPEFGGVAAIGTTGQGATSNLSTYLIYYIAAAAGDVSVPYTYAGDKGMAAAVLNAGPIPPSFPFASTGSLEAHETQYPDLVLQTGTPLFYYKMDEGAPPENYYNVDNRYPAVDSSTYGRTTGNWSWSLATPLTDGMEEPPLVRGSKHSVNFGPTKAKTFIIINDPTYDLAGGSTSYPSQAGPRWITYMSLVNIDQYASWRRLADHSLDRWYLALLPDGRLEFRVHVRFGPVVTGRIEQLFTLTDPTVLQPGRTYHIAATYDGSFMRVHIDGVVTSQLATTWTDGTTTYTSGEIMWTSGGAPSITVGSLASDRLPVRLDQVAFWNVALTPTQVQNLSYAALNWAPQAQIRATGTLRASRATYREEVLAKAPGAYYRLGEAPGATVMADASGNAAHGTYVGTPTLGVAGLLDGDGDTAMVASTTGSGLSGGTAPYASWMRDLTTGYTFEAIIQLPDLGVNGTQRTILEVGSAQEQVYVYRDGSGQPYLYWLTQRSASGGTSTGTKMTDFGFAWGDRAHVACVCYPLGVYREGQPLQYRHEIWINGRLAQLFAGQSDMVKTATVPVRIGHRNAATFTATFPIDEVALYPRPLSGWEIGQHARAVRLAPLPIPSDSSAVSGEGTLAVESTVHVVSPATVALTGDSELETISGLGYAASLDATGWGLLTAVGQRPVEEAVSWGAFGQLNLESAIIGTSGSTDLDGGSGLHVYAPIRGGQLPESSDPTSNDRAARRGYWAKG